MVNPVCSIIIRSFNEANYIGRLIEGIRLQTLYNFCEIILVDSGSTDSTIEIAKSFGVKIVHVAPSEFSFGRALNIGCNAANGEFLLFASAHVYPVYTNWVEKIIEPFKNPKVALVYGRQIGNEITKYSEHQVFHKWFPKDSNYLQQGPFCNNANAVIRKSLWEEQPYDELLTGLEDLDWGSKIQAKGWYIAYEALAPIVHVHEETPAKIRNRYRREAIALKKIFPKQHISFFGFLRLAFVNSLADCFHAFHEKVLWKNIDEIFQFRFMQFWGTYRGFRQKGNIDDNLKRRFYYPNDFRKKVSVEADHGEKINYHALQNQN